LLVILREFSIYCQQAEALIDAVSRHSPGFE
jgi:hypothetical protein